MLKMTRVFSLLALVAGIFVLSACREEEQGRPLFYDKGHYLGPGDTPLADENRELLRQRVGEQKP